MADPVVLRQAIEDLESEAQREVPVCHQKTFEAALQDADKRKKGVQQAQARRAGTAKKTNALQALIIDSVRNAPRLTAPALLERLPERPIGGVVDDVDEGTISFRDHDGRIKEAPISGLQNRLSRARKTLKQSPSR